MTYDCASVFQGPPQTFVNIMTCYFMGLVEMVETCFTQFTGSQAKGPVQQFNRQMPPNVRENNISILVSKFLI